VYYLLFIVSLIVAPVTKFTAFRPQKVVRLGRMGIVTSDAFFFFQGGVYYRFVQAYFLFFVAGIAHLIALLFEYKPWNYAVPEMTFLTLLLLYNRVHAFHFEVFIGECLMTINTILTHEPTPFNRGGAGGKVKSRAQENYYPGCEVYTVFV
jgi:hypothetical protein